jgi:hypothetical protein
LKKNVGMGGSDITKQKFRGIEKNVANQRIGKT